MFENKTQQQAKNIMLNLVDEYYNYYIKNQDKGDYIRYSGRVFDSSEMRNLVDSSLEFWLTSGRYTDEFEQKFAEYIGVRYCSLVNSGSSANLLAFMALTSPMLEENQILPGDEVISVAVCFPTTVAPIIQYGAVPVFVDVDIPQYNIDIDMLEQARTEKTKAVMLAHTLGNPFDLKAVRDFCDKYNLWLIEDNCDALGSEVEINGKTYKTGSVGDIGTSSFYPPHHITMGEGGAVYTSNPLLHKVIRSLRDWGRDCTCNPGQDNRCGCRFSKKYSELPLGYDHKYVYSHLGYNLKATDMQASIGVAQLKKLDYFVARRRENFKLLNNLLESCRDKIILPEACKNSNPSWFGYLITCKDSINRNIITEELEKNNIQTRTLFAGNILRHPCFDEIRNTNKYRVVGDLKNTDIILNNTFWVGVYPGLGEKEINKIADVIKNILGKI